MEQKVNKCDKIMLKLYKKIKNIKFILIEYL